MKAKDFDKKFEDGEDMTQYMDMSSVRRVNQETQALTIKLPLWLVRELDSEAARLGIARTAVINIRLASTFDKDEKLAA